MILVNKNCQVFRKLLEHLSVFGAVQWYCIRLHVCTTRTTELTWLHQSLRE